MYKKTLLFFVCCLFIFLSARISFPQKRGTAKPSPKPKPVIFAVLNDGQTLEPIALIEKGELIGAESSDVEPNSVTKFVSSYYKPKTIYNLIFGGQSAGTVRVLSSDEKSECGKNLAQAATASERAKIKGLVMGLATNAAVKKSASGVRRLPTPAERAEIESLVRAELDKSGVSANAVKKLKYQNLTALDVDGDGKIELVGSFWTENSENERNLLFFIAEKGVNDKYKFGFSEYNKVTPDEVMSGDLNDLDEGIYHELLLDVFDYNGDATAEVFTVTRAFEGNNFKVYSRRGGKWKKVYEGYNYHCAY